jgi:hypothetical protein
MHDAGRALGTVAKIQAKYGWGPGAAYFGKLGRLLATDPQSFWPKLDTLTWWGGAGSFADFYCFDASLPASECRADNRAYCKALAEIAEAMPKAGIHNARAQSWADIFRQWEAEGKI